jgi:dihydrofolate reductase
VLGRHTYEGDATWNARIMAGDVAAFVAELKARPGGTLVKYGNGPLDVALMERNLIDEFHLLLTLVARGRGRHLFEGLPSAPRLQLERVTPFARGVVLLVYAPGGSGA